MNLCRINVFTFRLMAVGLLLSGGAPSQVVARLEPGTGGDLSGPDSFLEEAKNLTLVGSLDGNFFDFQIVANLGYAAAGENGFQIIDLTDLVNPAVKGSDPQIFATSLFVSNQIASVLDLVEGLQLYDVSDPGQPIKLGTFQICSGTGSGCGDYNLYDYLYMSGEIAYLSIRLPEDCTSYRAQQYFLYILDISDPTDPVYLTSFETYESVRGIVVQDGIAFLTDDNLHVLDVSEPAFPAEIGFLGLDGIPTDIFLDGDIAFIASETGGIFSVDISDPAHPVQIGSYKLTDSRYDYNAQIFNRIAVQENLAYVSDWNHGLRVFYIKDPAYPGFVGHYPAETNRPWDPLSFVALKEGLIFFSLGEDLEILKYIGPDTFYQASGQVTDMAGRPVSGATVSDSKGHFDLTDADGIYTLSGLEEGSHTFALSHLGYTFSPTQRSITVPPDATGQDFVVELHWIFLPFAGGR